MLSRLKENDLGRLDIFEEIEINNKNYIRLDNKDSGQVRIISVFETILESTLLLG